VGRVGSRGHLRGISVSVYGMDVAEGMIAYARKHMPSNVALSVSDRRDIAGSRSKGGAPCSQ